MALHPKGINIDKAFTVSGVKEAGGYTYVLMIDFAGFALIKRISSDESEIKYHCLNDPNPESIDAFWADPTTHTSHGNGYSWINICAFYAQN